MSNGYMQYGGHRYICEFVSVNNWADYQGLVPKINCSFGVSNNYDLDEYKYFSVINCYGYAKILDTEIGTLINPSFFDVMSHLPTLSIILTQEQIAFMENMRNGRDVNIEFFFKALISMGKEKFRQFDRLEESDIVFNTVIPKSKWIDEFLPKWNFYNSVEKILFLDKLNSKQRLREIISGARQSLHNDNYEGVLINCFKALEALPKEIGYEDIKDMFNHLLSDGQDAEKLKYINNIYRATKEFMNLERHDKVIQTEERISLKANKSDAVLAITNTEILINYIIDNIKGVK